MQIQKYPFHENTFLIRNSQSAREHFFKQVPEERVFSSTKREQVPIEFLFLLKE